MLSVSQAKQNYFKSVEAEKQALLDYRETVRRSQERLELAQKSNLRRNQWVDTFKQREDLQEIYKSGSYSSRTNNDHNDDLAHVYRDLSPQELKQKKIGIQAIKNCYPIKEERALKAEEIYNDGMESSRRNRYREPVQIYEVLRPRLKTLDIHNSEMKMKRKNEIERIQDRISQLLDKPLSRNSLNSSLQKKNSKIVMMEQTLMTRRSNKEWKQTDHSHQSFTRLDINSINEPYKPKIDMIVRGNDKSHNNGQTNFKQTFSNSQCMTNMGSLRQFESLKDLIQLMTMQRNGQATTNLTENKSLSLTQRDSQSTMQGSSPITLNLREIQQPEISQRQPIKIPVIKSDNFDKKCKSLLRSIMLNNEDYIDKPKLKVQKLFPSKRDISPQLKRPDTQQQQQPSTFPINKEKIEQLRDRVRQSRNITERKLIIREHQITHKTYFQSVKSLIH